MTLNFRIRCSVLLLTVLLCAVAQANGPATDDCWETSRLAFQSVPDLVYGGQPDSLLTVLLNWEDCCGEAEPIMRLKILAAIWDDGFTEDIYDSRIIDALIWRYDSERQKVRGIPVDPSLAPGNIASPADFAFGVAAFDTFTMDLADQLLPHTPAQSVPRFFCLFYSGRVDDAFTMLQGQDLTGSDLRWYYQREMSYLRREEPEHIISLYGGFWRPEGNLLIVGDHAMVGLAGGIRHDHWIGRLVGEFRPGRSKYPYRVDQDGYTGMSDRFDNLYLGAELGRELITYGPHRIDIFVGLGYDAIKPFQEEDLVLATVNLNFGFGYRLFLGKRNNWLAGVDWRFESIGARNSGGTDLSGEALTVRFSLGYSFDSGKNRRISGLGH